MSESKRERGEAADRYTNLSPKRDRYLERARTCSEITIPALIPPEGSEAGIALPAPAQSNGAQGVNSLAAKILMAIMPPNLPIFRLEISDIAQEVKDAKDPISAQIALEIRTNLDRIPRAALLLTETFTHRPVLFEAMKHLVVSGNSLLWFLPTGEMRTVPLSRYVVLRDGLGFPIEIVVREILSESNLPQALRDIIDEDALEEAAEAKGTTPNFDLYTYACWKPERKKYEFYQEFRGKIVEGTTAAYTKDNFPLSPLRFSTTDGEDYGRGLVEEYMGLLQSIEAISQAEATLALAMSEIKWLVSTASGVRARDLQNAPQGAYLDGEPGSVAALVSNKYGDLAAISAAKQAQQRDFGMAFLVNTSIQRSGERVTAEEIRTMMQLLDSTLGGLYSSLAAEFQGPYVRFQLRLLKKLQGISIGSSGAIRTRVVTGIEALGQSNEAQQFFSGCKVMADLVGADRFAQMVIPSNLASKVFSYFSVDTAGVFKSEEMLAQEQADAQMAMQNEAAVAPIINAAGKALTK